MRLLCVCHGNICRSPMAEAILDREFALRGLVGWRADSAGTSNEERGRPTDPRTLQILRTHYILFDHVARQVTREDFNEFDYVLIMDELNRRNLVRLGLTPEQQAKIHLITEYDPLGAGDVPDPYYGDLDVFADTYAVLNRSLIAFLDAVSK